MHGVVQPALLVDEQVPHQPVDPVPGGGDLFSDGITEHIHDRPHEVVVDDLVLVRAEPQRDVFVGHPGQQVVRHLVRMLHQHARKGCDGTGERLLLSSVRLVPPVEEAVQKVLLRP